MEEAEAEVNPWIEQIDSGPEVWLFVCAVKNVHTVRSLICL